MTIDGTKWGRAILTVFGLGVLGGACSDMTGSVSHRDGPLAVVRPTIVPGVLVTLGLTADRTTILEDDSVVFTASLTPDSVAVGSSTVNTAISYDMGWTYTTVSIDTIVFDPYTTFNCTRNERRCVIKPGVSGTMWWKGTVNGRPDSIGVAITVNP